ncbi:MAG: bifunctional precorrin-2 dehydrogenase/sirohydrochlorin ferrochelatase [Proteobacteria bacterium]|nr:bifunctional precorrin-2 dehydrogenase/sirohydrochlorin ferrochelatase [Pseudomonadota bacterium]MBU1737475.1 bifunctional precorrin-2 dehydrogenase/sirohydrochlorin ferrochelatase [Pseudomonadota bacterium]
MNYFPINLKISGRRCVVIGGGKVAARKVKGLLECGGQVVVISPELTDELETLVREGLIGCKKKNYLKGDLDGAFLVIAATDDENAQAEVYNEAEEKGILVNVADVPERCNFILPATVSRNELAVSVSTGGKSPALARLLRKKLEKEIGPEYGVLADILGLLRPVVLSRGQAHESNRDVFNDILHDNFPIWIKNGNWDLIRDHLENVLGDVIDQECLNRIKNMIECSGCAKSN